MGPIFARHWYDFCFTQAINEVYPCIIEFLSRHDGYWFDYMMLIQSNLQHHVHLKGFLSWAEQSFPWLGQKIGACTNSRVCWREKKNTRAHLMYPCNKHRLVLLCFPFWGKVNGNLVEKGLKKFTVGLHVLPRTRSQDQRNCTIDLLLWCNTSNIMIRISHFHLHFHEKKVDVTFGLLFLTQSDTVLTCKFV